MKSNRKFVLPPRNFKRDNRALMFNMLVTAGMAIIVLFALLNVGTYINGTIASSLVETYATNNPSGSLDNTYYHNATGNATWTWRNITLPTDCTAGELSGTLTAFRIFINGSASAWPVQVNLTVNGAYTYNKSITNATWDNTTLTSLIASSNVSSGDTYLNFSWWTNNSGNRITIRTYGTYYQSGDYRTSLENSTVDTLEDITTGYDNTVEIVVVAAIITAITIPLAAIIAVKRLF